MEIARGLTVVNARLALATLVLVTACGTPEPGPLLDAPLIDAGGSAHLDSSVVTGESGTFGDATPPTDATNSIDANTDAFEASTDAGSDVELPDASIDGSADAGSDTSAPEAATDAATDDGSFDARDEVPADAPAEAEVDAPLDAGLICDPTVGCCPTGKFPACFNVGPEWVEACCAPSDGCQPIPDAGVHAGACN